MAGADRGSGNNYPGMELAFTLLPAGSAVVDRKGTGGLDGREGRRCRRRCIPCRYAGFVYTRRGAGVEIKIMAWVSGMCWRNGYAV